ncbi:hypothetical protein KI688_012955 [Linnemannia hyalina]|uniref:Cyclin N-terminal domain-containing protein n=1 Tax=Linnemannia hyalina TaxID=64524 RepID=A0A9P8BTB8_9FUNG|nr:hypothetical protein KI688_012955 [Linnemannia hyalina]
MTASSTSLSGLAVTSATTSCRNVMNQAKKHVLLPSHRVHHQHDDQGNNGVEPATEYNGNNDNDRRYNTFVNDLVDAPALTDDKDDRSVAKEYRFRQKVQVLNFAADMACHILYHSHNNAKLVMPTPEFRDFCVKVVAQFTTISPPVVFLALKYLARMVESLKCKNQRPSSNPGTDESMFTATLVLACNYLEEYDSNLTRPRIWARVTQIHKKEIESSRKMLLELLDYRLVTTPAEYADWMAYLVDHTMKHMAEHQFVPLEHQSLAELAPINDLYSTSDIGYIPPVLKTYMGDLIHLKPPPKIQEAGSSKESECDAAAVSSSHPQGQAQGKPRGEAGAGFSAEYIGDFAAHMACCILYGYRGSVVAANAKSDIVEPRPSFRKFCCSIIDISGLTHTVVMLALKYMQKLVWSLNSYNMYPEDDQKTENQIFAAAIMAAQKYADEYDQILTSGAWARIIGVSVASVNLIEKMFLEGVDYYLFTSTDEYNLWLGYLTHLTETVMPSQRSAILALRHHTTVSPMPLSDLALASEPASPAPKSVATGTKHTYPDGRRREQVRNVERATYPSETTAPSSFGGAGAGERAGGGVTAEVTVGATGESIVPPSPESEPSSAPYRQQPHSLKRPSQAARANRPIPLTAEGLSSSMWNPSSLKTSAPIRRRPAEGLSSSMWNPSSLKTSAPIRRRPAEGLSSSMWNPSSLKTSAPIRRRPAEGLSSSMWNPSSLKTSAPIHRRPASRHMDFYF